MVDFDELPAPKDFVKMPSGLWTPQQKLEIAHGMLGRYVHADPRLRHLGEQFYPQWGADAHFLAERMDVSHEHASAGMGRLSPQTSADLNRMMAYQATRLTPTQVKHIHKGAEHASAAASLQGQVNGYSRRNEPVPVKLQAELDKHRSAAMGYRQKAKLAGTPLNSQGLQAISMSLRNFHGETEDPLSTKNLGDVKIYDFSNTIHDENWRRQVIDTHMAHGGHNRTDIPYKADIGLGAKGRYMGYSGAADLAYQIGGEKGHLDPRETPPSRFMAGSWHGQIQAKLDTNPNAVKSRKADNSRTNNFLGAAKAHLWDPARSGQRPIENYFRFA